METCTYAAETAQTLTLHTEIFSIIGSFLRKNALLILYSFEAYFTCPE